MNHFALPACFVLLAGAAWAAPITLTGTLSGSNEIPTVSTAGSGSVFIVLDPALHSLDLSVTFSGLNSIDQAAHIHCCVPQPGNTGVATTVPAFPGFPLNVTSGSYHQVLNLSNAGTYNPAFVTAQGSLANAETALVNGLMNQQTYLNIHTLTSPGGEIRANLVVSATPEPATALLGASVLAALWLMRLRRRA